VVSRIVIALHPPVSARQRTFPESAALTIEQAAAERNRPSHDDDDSPAGWPARRFFSAITPQAEPFLQVAA